MKFKKSISTIVIGAAAALSLTACSNYAGNSGQGKEFKTNQSQQHQYEQSQPNPFFKFSEYRKITQQVETAEAKGLQGTAFFMSFQDYPIFTCTSLGQPVPATVQLTNPSQPYLQRVPGGSGGGYDYSALEIGNMDPNGVYSPPDASGTHVECVNAQGQKELITWEGKVLSVMGPAVWDDKANNGKGGIKLIGPPTQITIPGPVSASPNSGK